MNKDGMRVEYSTTNPKTGEVITSENPEEIILNMLQRGKPNNEVLFDAFRHAVENLRPALDLVTLAHVTMISHWQGDTITPIKKTREIADLYTPIGKIAKLIEDIEEIMHDAEQMKMF
jgi:hypothetical protein